VVGTCTGLRSVSEILTLKKANIDLGNGLLTVEGAYAKNGETVTLPMNARAVEALKQLIAKNPVSEYVFVDSKGKRLKSIRKAFHRSCLKCGLPVTGPDKVTPHVLRHTFASRLGLAGVSDGTIQALGRWKSSQMMQRYKHLTQSHLRDAVNKIGVEITPIAPEAR
jgi:integrase